VPPARLLRDADILVQMAWGGATLAGGQARRGRLRIVFSPSGGTVHGDRGERRRGLRQRAA
jgi:hypothetical protein